MRELAAQRGMLPAALAVPAVSDAQIAQVAALGADGQLWAEGLQLYATSCTTCHGANGEGSALAVPLNTPEVRAKDAATLTRTITEGVPGTMMAPWGKTLEQPEIDALVALLQHWDQLAAAGVALAARAPQAIDLSDPQAVLALGERLFVSTCTSCHGENGTGGIGPAINSQQFLSRKDDAAITQAITVGGRRPGSAMPAFGERLTTVEIDALVRYIRSLEATAPSVANPRGTQQGGGGPPWLRATAEPGATPSAGGGQGQGQGQRQGQGQGGGPPPWAGGRQSTPAQGTAQLAPATVYRGTVVSMASTTLTFTDAASGAQLEAMLGPPWWWETNAIALSPGDQVELEGFQGEGHMELNWLQNLTTGVRLELRTADGTPVWQQ
ncbi:MAG: c-type cytochrome [Chloroflexales bacterium]|nr:c-type cytochrome [Chloroflexales bacterium]